MTTLFRCSPNFIRQRLRSSRISFLSSPCNARRFSDKKSNPPAKPDPAPEHSGYYAGSAEEQFGSNAFWAFRNLGKILAWVGYGTVVTGIATLTAFEGAHLWIEQQMRFDQDEDAKAWGWEPELWSGGDNGGTSASLGLYGRHVVRAAWFALHYHSPFAGFAMNSKGGNGNGDAYNFVNADVQIARAYLENVLASRQNEDGTLRLDRVTLELLEQYASVLERIGTRATLVKAGESYSLIYNTRNGDAALRARYAAKLGNISERVGDGTLALAWWKRSLALIGQAEENLQNNTRALLSDKQSLETLNMPNPPGINRDTQRETGDEISTAATAASAWGFGLKNHPLQKNDVNSSEASSPSPSALVSGLDEDVVEIPDFPPRSPLGQRVLITVLLALSAHYSRRERLSEAKSIQEKAISLINLMSNHGKAQTWAEKLHQLFLLHRLSLFHVHHGEVNFALQKESGTNILTELHEAASLSEKVANALTEGAVGKGAGANDSAYVIYKKSKWMARDAQTLLRDARLTATEAWDLSGVLYRRMASDPEKAVECFEKALRWAGEPETGSLSAQAWESLLERFKDSKQRLNSSSK